MIHVQNKMKKGYIGTLKIKKMYIGNQQIFSGELEKLATPTNITFNSSTGLISWDAVPNANGYSIYLGSPLYSWTNISTNSVYYKELTFKYEGDIDYTNISVKALGDGINYSDSDAAPYNRIWTTQLPYPSPSRDSNSQMYIWLSHSTLARHVTAFIWEMYNGSILVESGTVNASGSTTTKSARVTLTESKYSTGITYTFKCYATNTTISNTYTDSQIRTTTYAKLPKLVPPVLEIDHDSVPDMHVINNNSVPVDVYYYNNVDWSDHYYYGLGANDSTWISDGLDFDQEVYVRFQASGYEDSDMEYIYIER